MRVRAVPGADQLVDHAVAALQVEVVIGRTRALPMVDLHLEHGEVLALMGPSGSGKTTLLDCILGLQRPSSGSIFVFGHQFDTLSEGARSLIRRKSIGIVSQNPQLLAELSVVENVAITMLLDGMSRRRALQAGRQSLSDVGLAGAEDLRPENLSGGEAQRVALARALASPDVRLIVADEPTAALDEANVGRIADLLLRTARARGLSVLVATHDAMVAARCDRVQQLRSHLAHADSP